MNRKFDSTGILTCGHVETRCGGSSMAERRPLNRRCRFNSAPSRSRAYSRHLQRAWLLIGFAGSDVIERVSREFLPDRKDKRKLKRDQ